ncbi:MAG: hypothetical protein M0R30_13580 [Methanoregula sp.]|uniref:hypothetical protein n=1 Tax=Methanoregula sp. TaxID=2052170 RepID=UPI0025CC36F0|nr:hypothetical protein [Methanoregula sp.]MCK9632657.1 hypothetical protein [Methanoregula sp.]
MNVRIDQRFLNRVIIILVVCMIVTGVLIGLKTFGFLGTVPKSPDALSAGNVTGGDAGDAAGNTPVRTSTRQQNVTANNTDDHKTLTLSWTYNNESFQYTQVVSNKTYYSFRPKAVLNGRANGSAQDIRLLPYTVTTGDEGLIRGIATYILSESEKHGWGDYDTVGNLVSFLSQYDGSGSFRNLKPATTYKYPFQILYDGGGSRDDVTILGTSLLESMGYPVAFLDYPRQYDRGYFIYEYEGIAVRCDESVSGKKYFLENATDMGTTTCWPGTGLCYLPNGSVFRTTDGILRGNTTIFYTDNRTQDAGAADWDVRSGVVSYREGFVLRSDRLPAYLEIGNATWIYRKYYCYIDTTDSSVLPATIPGPLAKTDPLVVPLTIDTGEGIKIYQDNRIDATLNAALRSPSPLNRTNQSGMPSFEKSVSSELNIPVPSGNTDEILPENQQLEQQYWNDVWYDESTWYYDQVWYLDVVNYSVIEQSYLYTRQNEIYIAPASAWRIRYAAIPINPPDEELPGLSTFSDMRFAVYKINEETNTAVLFDTFSYGYATGQDDVKYQYYYETGTFYIAVFVRNCEADVAVQMHGKKPVTGG